MSSDVAVAPLTESRRFFLKTWHIFLLVLAANLVLTYLFNTRFLTRDVYYHLLSDRLDTERIDMYFDLLHKVSLWGYLAQPLLLWIRISFVVLLIQMPLLLFWVDIPYRKLFRIVTTAHVAMIASSLSQVVWLACLEPTRITQGALSRIPLSVNSFLDPANYPVTAYAILGKVNIFEVIWCILIYKGLAATEKLKKDYTALLVFALWTMLLLFQWGISAYLNGVNS